MDVSDPENPTAQPKTQDFDTYADALWWGLVRTGEPEPVGEPEVRGQVLARRTSRSRIVR